MSDPRSSSSNATVAYAATGAARYNLSLSGNPLGCSPSIDKNFNKVASEVGFNPSGYPHLGGMLRQTIADFYGVNDQNIYVGPWGAYGVIASVFRSGLISLGQTLVVPETVFPAAAVAAKKQNVEIEQVKMRPDLGVDFDRLKKAVCETQRHKSVGGIFLCNPNNPTGIAEPIADIIDLATACPNTLVVVSEANMELVNDAAYRRIGGSLLDPENFSKLPSNILVVRSFSKAYGLANDRLGYAVGAPRLIEKLAEDDTLFALGDREVIRACIAMQDPAHVRKTRKHIATEMSKVKAALGKLGFHHISKSDSNLVLAGVPDYFGGEAKELIQKLYARDCSVVNCGPEFGDEISGKYIRLTPSTSENNDQFLRILKGICEEKRAENNATVHQSYERSTLLETLAAQKRGQQQAHALA